MAFEPTGNFVARGADKVDAQLVQILKEAAERAGMQVQAYSGYRPGDKRAHGRGLATDLRIIGPDGKALANYQDPTTFSTYEKLAQEARKVQMEKYPELKDRFRWGGYFGGPKGKYGAMDTMHFDLAGGNGLGMAGGSWDKGLTEQQAALFPGAKSQGMGLMDILNPEFQAKVAARPQPPIAQQIAANQTPTTPQSPGTPAPKLPSPINVGDRPVVAPQETPQAAAPPPGIMAALSGQSNNNSSGGGMDGIMQMLMASQTQQEQPQQMQLAPMPQRPQNQMGLSEYIQQFLSHTA